MKHLICSLFALFVISAPGCKSGKAPPSTSRAALDVLVFTKAYTQADVTAKQTAAGCPNKANPACNVYTAGHKAMDAVDLACKGRNAAGQCVNAPWFPEVSTTYPLWIECSVGTTGCQCAIRALGFIKALWRDHSCNGTGRWDAIYECPNGEACGCMNSNDECDSSDT